MEKITVRSWQSIPVFTLFSILILSGFYSVNAKASTQSATSNSQLAYYVNHPHRVYYGPQRYYNRHIYYRGHYRHACRKSCLVNRWGHVVRCKRICR